MPELPALSRPIVALLIVVGGFVVNRITRFVLRRVVRRVADRSLVRPSRWWRTRAQRDGMESNDEFEDRRRQRIDAATRMIHHLVALVVWIAVSIGVFHVLQLDAAFFLSSAGFLGAAVAIGGQHKVNDYITGMSVLLEDRYGVGDEIEVQVGWTEPVHGIVEHIGLVSTRIRDAHSTVHLSHTSLANVRNISQEPAKARLEVQVSGLRDDTSLADAVALTMRELAGTKDLTSVVFVDDIATFEPSGQTEKVKLDITTSRPLSDDQRRRLVRRTERILEDRVG